MNETQRCTGRTAKGDPCPNNLTRLFEGVGYRCRHHVPDGAGPFNPSKTEPEEPAPQQPDPPPFTREPRTMKDIRRLSAWALAQVVQNKMGKDQADQIAKLCQVMKAALIEEQVKGDVDKIKRTQRKIHDAARKNKNDDDDVGTD